MKKITKLSLLAGVGIGLSSCASYVPYGFLYTGTKTGLENNNGVAASKTGQACMSSVLGLVAWGDGSIESAKADGNITKVATINYATNNILGIYGQYCTVATGE